MKRIVGIIFVMVIALLVPTLSVGAKNIEAPESKVIHPEWHGSTSVYSDCDGWKVTVNTVWSGFEGFIISSSHLEGTWGDLTSTPWSVLVGWDTGETWGAGGTINKRGDCKPEPIYQDQSKCEGTTLIVWQEVSYDNGKTWSVVDGSTVTTPNSSMCGYETPKEPKGHWCTVCIKVIVDPQWVQCLVNRAADVKSIMLGTQTMVRGVDYRVMSWNNIEFADGDLMNALFKSGTVLKMVLTNGEKIDLQVTPGVDHGYSNGCYIAWSSTWGDTKPAAGTMTITDPTGKGPDCINVLVWKEDSDN